MIKFFWICTSLVFGTVIFLGSAEESFADVDNKNGKSPTFLYRIGLDLMYLSEAAGTTAVHTSSMIAKPGPADTTQPSTSGTTTSSSPTTTTTTGSATLGLKKAFLDFDWRFPRGAGVEMVLRPEAVDDRNADGTDLTELDTRSGHVVEGMPTIHFLDQYRLVFRQDAVEGHVGVEDHVIDDFKVTPDVLDFGLRVLGPRKIFAIGVDAPTFFPLDSSTSNYIGFGFNLITDRNDRHDLRTDGTSGVGQSPAQKNPYWGVAGDLHVADDKGFRVGVSGALVEEKVTGGKVHLQWMSAGVKRTFRSYFIPQLQLGVEGRQLHETFSLDGTTDISDVTLNSFGATSSIFMTTHHAALVGIWAAMGEIHPPGVLSSSPVSRAAQGEIGWRWLLEDQLDLTTVVTREWRVDGVDGGGTTGGFQSGTDTKSTQSRIAVQLQYRIGGQI